MSSGDKNSTTVTKSDPPSWAVPYFQQALQRADSISKQPYVGYGGPRVADFSDDQYAGFDLVRQQAAAGQPLNDAASGYVTNQLRGRNAYQGGKNPYAGSNPYLQQQISAAQNDTVDSYNKSVVPDMMAQFNSGGAYGGTAHMEAMQDSQSALAGQLGRISSDMRNTDYDRQAQLAESALGRNQQAWAQNQGNSLAALGAIPGLNQGRYDDARALMNIGQQQQALSQDVYDTAYNNFTDWRDWDANRLGVLSNALGTIQGGTGSQTGANPNYRSAGQNAAAAAMVLASMWGS